jgi:DNA-directed RNA polymerase specialized sigma24 family protein
MQIQIDNPSEQAILTALREGKNRHAAGLLIAYHGNSIYNVCRSLIADAEQAEDLTQEVFRRAFARLDGLLSAPSPRIWLAGIAQQCCSEAVQVVSSPAAAELPEFDPLGTDLGNWRISDSLKRRLEMLASAL